MAYNMVTRFGILTFVLMITLITLSSSLEPLLFSLRRTSAGFGVYSSLAEAARDVSFTLLNTGRPLVVFHTGNSAATPIAMNMLASIRLLRRPFRVLIVPAEETALNIWTEHAHKLQSRGEAFFLLHDTEILARRAQPQQFSFREHSYNQLTLLKWVVVRRLLALGFDAMVLDPDLFFLRDPFAFIELNAPNCSIISATEGGGNHISAWDTWDYAKIESAASLSPDFPVAHWNTGQTIFRADPEMIAVIDEYLPWAIACIDGGNELDDQRYWNVYLATFYTVKPRAAGRSVGTEVADSLTRGNCISLQRSTQKLTTLRSSGKFDSPRSDMPAPQALTLCVFPLHHALFLHRISMEQELFRSILLPPIVIHYNYVESLAEKMAIMIAAGHWLL